MFDDLKPEQDELNLVWVEMKAEECWLIPALNPNRPLTLHSVTGFEVVVEA